MWKPNLLKYDLSEKKISIQKTIEPKIVENFLGGRGITVYLAYHSIPVDASPRGTENEIILGTGILTGTNYPSTGMIVCTFKSPQTNTLFTSISTGKFGAYLKHSGIDFLQISGSLNEPHYILIDEFHDILLQDATEIWKKNVPETDEFLRNKHGKDISIATIGQAAVNQVFYSGVAVDRMNFFQRGGLGVVFASKNLKAIVISESPPEEKIENLLKDDANFLSQLKSHSWYKMIKTRGTFSIIFPALEKRILGIKNCSRLLSMKPEKISSFKGYQSTYDCWKCPIRCSHNKYQDFLGLGLNLKITDLESIQNAIEVCASEAIDPLSLGASIGSLLNIQEDRRKLLDEVIGITWGDPALLRLIDSIISVNELGEKLARGETYLYKQTSEPSPAVKNQFAGLYYYPNTKEIALAHSISSYSASELHSDYMLFPSMFGYPYTLNNKSTKGIVRTLILMENILASLDSLILCSRFLPFILEHKIPKSIIPEEVINFLFSFFSSFFVNNFGLSTKNFANSFSENLMELKLDPNNLFKIGNRITLLERLFNTRAGFTKSDDQFEPFIFNKEFFKEQESLLEEYYQQKGLTKDGMVSKKSLKKTGLLGLVTI